MERCVEKASASSWLPCLCPENWQARGCWLCLKLLVSQVTFQQTFSHEQKHVLLFLCCVAWRMHLACWHAFAFQETSSFQVGLEFRWSSYLAWFLVTTEWIWEGVGPCFWRGTQRWVMEKKDARIPPWAKKHLGPGWGDHALVNFFAETRLYTWQSLRHWKRKPQQNHFPFVSCRIPILVSIQVNLFGSSAVFLLLASENVQSILQVHAGINISFCYWLLLVTAVLLPLAWLGTPKDFW